METDMELTEKAAEAAGLNTHGLASKHIAQGVSEHALLYTNKQGGSSVFDPLLEDGDAFMLAKRMAFDVDFAFGVVKHANGKIIAVSDRCTRLAITRAAAKLAPLRNAAEPKPLT